MTIAAPNPAVLLSSFASPVPALESLASEDRSPSTTPSLSSSRLWTLLADRPVADDCGGLRKQLEKCGTNFNPDLLVCEAERRARLESVYFLLDEADSFVFLDTEATGNCNGRLIEAALLETDTQEQIVGGLHFRCNPHRRSSSTARRVHGILDCELEHCREFAAHADDLLDAVRGKVVVIHDRTMDLRWLNRELELARPGAPRFEEICTVVDTLVLAKAIPSERRRNGLDALLDWYGLPHASGRHGAYGDANMLSKVFFELWWDLDEYLFGN